MVRNMVLDIWIYNASVTCLVYAHQCYVDTMVKYFCCELICGVLISFLSHEICSVWLKVWSDVNMKQGFGYDQTT